MVNFEIKNHKTNTVLFAGKYISFKHCLNAAVAQNVNLHYADLRQKDLAHTDLDGGLFDGSLFSGSNMNGINLSDADLRHCDFSNTTLHGACLCLSDLTGSRFNGALFGSTDIAGAVLDRCLFSTESALLLDYSSAYSLHGSIFHDEYNDIRSLLIKWIHHRKIW